MTHETEVRALIERLNQGVLVISHDESRNPVFDVVTTNQAMRKAARTLEALLARNEHRSKDDAHIWRTGILSDDRSNSEGKDDGQ